jgi:hypothetical protein
LLQVSASLKNLEKSQLLQANKNILKKLLSAEPTFKTATLKNDEEKRQKKLSQLSQFSNGKRKQSVML